MVSKQKLELEPFLMSTISSVQQPQRDFECENDSFKIKFKIRFTSSGKALHIRNMDSEQGTQPLNPAGIHIFKLQTRL